MRLTNRSGATSPPAAASRQGRPGSGRGHQSACAAAAIVLLSAGLLDGCGSSPHTHRHRHRSTGVTSGALAYSNCMRAHGVPDFPDPNGQGEFQLHTIFENGRPIHGADLTPSSPAFQAGERACGQFGSAGRQVTPAQERKAFQQALRAAVCMRAHGILSYPDPKLVGGSIDQEYDGKFNPDSRAFQRAAKECTRPGVVLSGSI